MRVEDACNSRVIRKVGGGTPLLVPSFSSVISEDIKDIRANLVEYINKTSLVSAYDLHYELIDITDLGFSEIVFVDSGKYEVDFLKDSINLEEWNKDYYLKTLDRLIPTNEYVIVNYDEKVRIEEQIKQATELFVKYPKYASCFLYKPLSNENYKINTTQLIEHMTSIDQFDIIGLAEKELGNSMHERCTNIVRIREGLSKRIEIPIHIFGCLDPLSIIAYSICGADIFDGLSWMRYTFHDDVALYYNNHALLNKMWSEPDNRVRAHSYVTNLIELTRLEVRIRHFTRTHDFDSLQLPNDKITQLKALTGAAGIDYEGG